MCHSVVLANNESKTERSRQGFSNTVLGLHADDATVQSRPWDRYTKTTEPSTACMIAKSRDRREGTIFDWRVKVMRAMFRGVHRSVINDNKNTVIDLVSEYNIITMYIASITTCGCVPENSSLKKSGGRNTTFDPTGKFRGGVKLTPCPHGSRAPVQRSAL